MPALKRKMEKYRGGGMNGEISVDLGVEALEVEHEYGGPERQLFAQWGITKADGVMLRFAGALQSDASGEVTPIEIVMRGRHEELNLGDAEGGKHSPFKVKSTLTYLVHGRIDRAERHQRLRVRHQRVHGRIDRSEIHTP